MKKEKVALVLFLILFGGMSAFSSALLARESRAIDVKVNKISKATKAMGTLARAKAGRDEGKVDQEKIQKERIDNCY